MKRALVLTSLVVLVLMLACTAVKANTTRDELIADLLKESEAMGLDVTKAELDRALPSHVAEWESDEVFYYLDEAKAAMGDKKFADLSKDEKKALLPYAESAAALFDLEIKIDGKDKTVTVVDKDGNEVASRSYDAEGKLVQTGSDNLVFVALSGLAIIAIAGTVVVKKVRANA